MSAGTDWKTELVEAVDGLRTGKRAVAAVLCVAATESEVEQFLKSAGIASSQQKAKPGVAVKVRKYGAEEYDFDWDEGVEVVVSRFPEFLEVYARLGNVPDGILRRTLRRFLLGQPLRQIAADVGWLISKGYEDGVPREFNVEPESPQDDAYADESWPLVVTYLKPAKA